MTKEEFIKRWAKEGTSAESDLDAVIQQAIADHDAGRIKQILAMKTFGDRLAEDFRNSVIENITNTLMREMPEPHKEGGEG